MTEEKNMVSGKTSFSESPRKLGDNNKIINWGVYENDR